VGQLERKVWKCPSFVLLLALHDELGFCGDRNPVKQDLTFESTILTNRFEDQ
jgi:hypothetical protein